MANFNSATLVKLSRMVRLSAMSRRKRSTMFGHEALMGVKCGAVQELARAVERIETGDVDRLVERIAEARHVSVFGCRREGLQIQGFAMRLFHLGRSVSVVGDMATPHIGRGDLFLVTARPGTLPTVLALTGVARIAGARVMCITADPEGAVPQDSDDVPVLPAQTMATDQMPGASSLPMGSPPVRLNTSRSNGGRGGGSDQAECAGALTGACCRPICMW